MSVMDRPQPVETAVERAVRLSVTAAARRTTVDPLFRRRLRGQVLNRYVAAREGVAVPVSRGRRMSRVGRACLFASVALAMSVGGVMAASRAAAPGDLLYPVKRQLEEIRAAVLPAHLHDELAAYAFEQRVTELGRLIEAGDLKRASALMPDVRSAFEELLALRPDTAGDSLFARHLAVLADLLERLPEPAREALERSLERAPGLTLTGPPGGGQQAPPPHAGGPDREAREGPDRGQPADPGSPSVGEQAGPDGSKSGGSGRGPDDSGPRATPGEPPDPSDGAEPQDESD